MHLLILLHRWWGVAFCLLFAMWFASGIVMHFVPFPARDKAVTSTGRVEAVSEDAARDVAAGYARSHRLDASRITAERVDYDQWTVSGDYDPDRPLFRVALNDTAGTILYVSSTGGDIVLVTTRQIRTFNYFGSIAHWIYPVALRHHTKVWLALVWWLSLIGTMAWASASSSASLGLALRSGRRRPPIKACNSGITRSASYSRPLSSSGFCPAFCRCRRTGRCAASTRSTSRR